MADTVNTAPAPTPAAPAVMRTGMDSHGMKFVPREVITDYRDRLYHGKTEYNHKGIPYRTPRRVEKANAGDRLAVFPRQPLSDSTIRDMAEEHFRQTGRKPTAITYAGAGVKYARGLSVSGVGLVFVDLVSGPEGDYEPFVSADEAVK